jgi:cytochrome c oxidase subunit II
MSDTLTEQPPSAPPVPPVPPAWRRAPVGPILGLFVLWCLVLLPFALYVPSHLMGTPASSHMREIENTVRAFSVASVPVAAMVWSIGLYSLLAWRYRGEGPPPEEAPPLRGDNRVQVVWLVVSGALCLFLLIWGLTILESDATDARAAQGMVVDVTGNQWVWTFDYPAHPGVSSDELVLPVNAPVTFKVTSKDVVHSFWIVQMGVKIDANPGETTEVSVTPDRIGRFTVRCAELCGLHHAYMQTDVRVVSAQDYATWLDNQSAAASAS